MRYPSEKSWHHYVNKIFNWINPAFFSFSIGTLLLMSLRIGEPGFIKSQVTPEIEFAQNTGAKKVDILVNGNIFTSYLFADSLEKPVFFPVFAPGGVSITRGYPLDPRQGERIDHPHHTGLWFNYGNVNRLDFWNNSREIPASKKCDYGTIICLQDSIRIDSSTGSLQVVCHWINYMGEVLLMEKTLFIFRMENPFLYSLERMTRMTAVTDSVVFDDSKEGLLGIRVARSFEMPSAKPCVLYDTNAGTKGNPRIDSTGVNGRYIGSNGLSGDAVWGTRNSWITLSALSNSDSVSIAIIDHPQNHGFPSYWHAREYGLFSVNNLGIKSFDPEKMKAQLILKKNKSVVFRHLVLVKSGGFLTPADMERHFRSFSEEKNRNVWR